MSKILTTTKKIPDIAKRLTKFAELHFGTKYAMAQAIGIEQGNFTKYCNGTRPIGKKTLKRFADLGISMKWLLEGVGEQTTKAIYKYGVMKNEEKKPSKSRIRLQIIYAGVPATILEETALVEIDFGGLVNRDTDFAVRVTGDSMTGAGIHDRDILVMTTTRGPSSGDIVAAIKDEGGMVLMRYKSNGITSLQSPDDQKQKPIPYDDSWKILGTFKILIRAKLP